MNFIKNLIKESALKFGVEIRRIDLSSEQCVSLKPKNESKGNVLLSYTINPFLLEEGQKFTTAHHCDWEAHQIAKTFLERGYSVDVINYNNDKFTPKKNYSFFIDVLTNLERIAPLLNKDCIKIMHIIFAHWLAHNAASHQRYVALQQRKRKSLKPQRLLPPNFSIEYADYATMIGNSFTCSTYQYAKKPIYRTAIATNDVYPWAEGKDYDKCRKHFLWLGGSGFVHKGLDLVLDAFAELPDHHLTVCGAIQTEKDFEELYYRELYETANIHTIGWIDVSTAEFIQLANNCIGVIFPSCAESGCGGVITCLHAGLIPLVTYESSVDVDQDFGLVLRICSIEDIKNAIRMVSSLPTHELKRMSQTAWEFARSNHTREKFAEAYGEVVDQILMAQACNQDLDIVCF